MERFTPLQLASTTARDALQGPFIFSALKKRGAAEKKAMRWVCNEECEVHIEVSGTRMKRCIMHRSSQTPLNGALWFVSFRNRLTLRLIRAPCLIPQPLC